VRVANWSMDRPCTCLIRHLFQGPATGRCRRLCAADADCLESDGALMCQVYLYGGSFIEAR